MMPLTISIQWDHPNPFFNSKLINFIGNGSNTNELICFLLLRKPFLDFSKDKKTNSSYWHCINFFFSFEQNAETDRLLTEISKGTIPENTRMTGVLCLYLKLNACCDSYEGFQVNR